ncbi:unnamed protein product [Fusarium graminearum]|uniref:Uncharacterized protein n=1 Tax=Gibberella zeae TaxID=5518 RepID=A0A4E9EIK1_GIBZA|nr:unnamed protein product [Fusarium graminearum]CAF3581776.1 unnamed protein product [Fusarium graminearum]CAG1988532.1 unnamed protein product [Fusarium graminearum]CAG1997492.1 unnamed protein product [Fusarium graminearum]
MRFSHHIHQHHHHHYQMGRASPCYPLVRGEEKRGGGVWSWEIEETPTETVLSLFRSRLYQTRQGQLKEKPFPRPEPRARPKLPTPATPNPPDGNTFSALPPNAHCRQGRVVVVFFFFFFFLIGISAPVHSLRVCVCVCVRVLIAVTMYIAILFR